MFDARKNLATILAIALLSGTLGSGVTVLLLSERDSIGNFFDSPRGSLDSSIPKVTTEEEVRTIAAVKRITPAVVSIVIRKEVSRSSGRDSFDDIFGDLAPFGFSVPAPSPEGGEGEKLEVGGGTGFIVSADGLIVTNRHVVEDPDAEYTVLLADGERLNATIVDIDRVQDVAVLRVERKGLPTVRFGDSSKVEIGQTVIAIGNALSEFRNTVTKGVISGVNRRVTAGDRFGASEVIEGAIQTDAAINFGNSGGPLMTLDGDVVGMNTAVSRSAEAIGFAIPSAAVQKIVESVREHGRILRPRLGVQYVLLSKSLAASRGIPVDYGAFVVGGDGPSDPAVIAGSPAEKAGLAAGDIILSIEGKKIDEERPLGGAIAEYDPGDSVTLRILRKGEEKELRVTLDEWKK